MSFTPNREQMYRLIAENMTDMIGFLDREGNYVYASPSHHFKLGYDVDELLHKSAFSYLHPSDQARIKDRFFMLPNHIDGVATDFQFKNANNEYIHLEIHAKPIYEAGEWVGVLVVGRDVTEIRKAWELVRINEQRFRSLFEFNPNAIYAMDGSGVFTQVNPATERLTGYSADELIGSSSLKYVHPDDRVTAIRNFRQALKGTASTFEMVTIHKSGSNIQLSVTYVPMTINGQIVGVFGITTDITEEKNAKAQVEFLAYHDPLTHLLNRRSLDAHIKACLAASKPHLGVAILLIDLDEFKRVNDTYGHHAGDALICGVSERLQEIESKHVSAFRLGGDEFCVVVCRLTSPDEAQSFAEHVLAALSEKILYDNWTIRVTPSIGFAYAPKDGQLPETLLIHADHALYAAKRSGKNRVVAYAIE